MVISLGILARKAREKKPCPAAGCILISTLGFNWQLQSSLPTSSQINYFVPHTEEPLSRIVQIKQNLARTQTPELKEMTAKTSK